MVLRCFNWHLASGLVQHLSVTVGLLIKPQGTLPTSAPLEKLDGGIAGLASCDPIVTRWLLAIDPLLHTKEGKWTSAKVKC